MIDNPHRPHFLRTHQVAAHRTEMLSTAYFMWPPRVLECGELSAEVSTASIGRRGNSKQLTMPQPARDLIRAPQMEEFLRLAPYVMMIPAKTTAPIQAGAVTIRPGTPATASRTITPHQHVSNF